MRGLSEKPRLEIQIIRPHCGRNPQNYTATCARGNVNATASEIKKFAALNKSEISKICRQTAVENFDAKAAFGKYCELYRSLVP
ncbi:MAG: hypothetical protein DBY30_00120 [Verrucomicrobia bacterium]|nr:MAG: hypothetical protein DBY30_00120 [Verrucomicrobiota bacterium]